METTHDENKQDYFNSTINDNQYCIIRLGGVRCPILFSNSTVIKGIRKENIILEQKGFNIVTIGFGGSEGIQSRKSYLIIRNGRIVFRGKTNISAGSTIRVDNGTLEFGKNFSCNNNCSISCSRGVKFGNDVLLGWNVNIRDSDGHNIYYNNELKESQKTVNISDHVWIASFVDILKGVYIGANNVIAYRSCISKSFDLSNCLIGGNPGKILQNNIRWEK